MVIDAHLHLWDPARHRYEWLLRPGNELLNRTFTFADFEARATEAGVDKAVLVQADDHSADTEAMFEVACAHERVAGVVAWVPLDRPADAAVMLDGLRARPKFAGIRNLIHDQPDPDWLLRPEVGEGLALLERAGIPFDVVAVLPRHIEHVPVLSERYPRLRMVLDHLAHPPLGGADWEPWRTLITAAAANPLVYAKLSGLYPQGTADITPFVEFALKLFGPDRLMFGSDWPVAELAGGYQPVARTLLDIIGQLPAAQRDAILAGTARDFYSLALYANNIPASPAAMIMLNAASCTLFRAQRCNEHDHRPRRRGGEAARRARRRGGEAGAAGAGRGRWADSVSPGNGAAPGGARAGRRGRRTR